MKELLYKKQSKPAKYYGINMSESDKQRMASGLHSVTMFKEIFEEGYKIEYHEHPVTGELVVMEIWFENTGEDVAKEFEVVAVYPYLGCLIAKMNA